MAASLTRSGFFINPGMLFEKGCNPVYQMLEHTEIGGMEDIRYCNGCWGDAFRIPENTI